MGDKVILKRRSLGSSDLMVAPISLGTVKLGRNTGVKYPEKFELPSDQQIVHLLETASELGVNLIDTAPAYGNSEQRLGKLLPGAREDWVLCTKAGETYVDNTSLFDFSENAIEQSVSRSLKHLGTDYLDIVLLHSNGDDLEILDHTSAMETLARLKTRGDIRLIGISTKTVEGGLKALEVSDVVMVSLNANDQSQLDVIAQAQSMQKGILLKKVMESGLGVPDNNLRFALSCAGVHSAVLGTINPEHLRQNAQIAAATLESL